MSVPAAVDRLVLSERGLSGWQATGNAGERKHLSPVSRKVTEWLVAGRAERVERIQVSPFLVIERHLASTSRRHPAGAVAGSSPARAFLNGYPGHRRL
jgi:hypothetical protein